MRRAPLIFVGAAALAFALAGPAEAGPWTKSPGELYLKLSEGVFLAGELGDARSRSASSGAEVTQTSLTTALYAELGVLPRLHAQLYLPHVVGKSAYAGGYDYLTLGLGDALLGLQWTPGVLPFAHAIRAEVKLPLYELPPDPRFAARGDGQVDVTLALSAGTSLDPLLPGWISAEVGARFRTELYLGRSDGLAFGDGLTGALQLGVSPLAGLQVAANLGAVLPYRDDETTQGWVTLGGAVLYALTALQDGLALEASCDGTVWAVNSTRGLSLALGLSYRR